MKLKDLFKMVEMNNQFANFMERNGYKEIQIVKVDDRALYDLDFKNVKALVNEINECYYANIDSDIELVNDNGYIHITFETSVPDFKLVDGHVQKFEIKKEETLNLYIETKQIWG